MVSYIGLTEVPGLGKLEVLDISHNLLTKLPSIRALQSLKTLVVESNHLSNTVQFDGKMPCIFCCGIHIFLKPRFC